MKKKRRRRFTLLMVVVLIISQICATNIVAFAHEENTTISNYSEENKTEDINNDSIDYAEEDPSDNSEKNMSDVSKDKLDDGLEEDSNEDAEENSSNNSGKDSSNNTGENTSDGLEGKFDDEGLGEDSNDGEGEDSSDELEEDHLVEAPSEETEGNANEYAVEDVSEEEVNVKSKETIIKEAVFNLNDTSEKTTVSGSITWNDANNQDGKRPQSVNINLLANGTKFESTVVTEEDNWTFKFDNIDKYANGEEIEYTITEDEVEYYTTEINGTKVFNTHIPEKTKVEGSKTWVADKYGQEEIPESITIWLYAGTENVANKVVTAEDDWSWKFENLDKYKDGQEIVYTIKEDQVSDYSTEYDGYDVINTYTPDYTQMSVVKVWDDNNNQDGIRPKSIKVQLYSGLFPKGDVVEMNEDNNWSYTWSNLPASKFGFEVYYSVREVDKVDGYETKSVSNGNITTITNVHTPEKTSVSGSKTWNDADNQDGKRPESITINLLANGTEVDSKVVTERDNWTFKFDNLDKYANGEEIKYTITENEVEYYTTEIKGTRVTNTHIPEKTKVEGSKTWVADKNGQEEIPESITIRLYAGTEEVASKVVTAEDDWSWKFENLDKFKDGQEIVYSITEDQVSDYSTEYDGYNVINTYTPDYTQMSVVKVWDDNNNQDGIRPKSIKVQLYSGLFPKGDVVELNEDNNWSYTWSNLPESRFGFKVNYSVREVGKVDGYETKSVNNGNITTITNVHTSEKTVISGSKTWNDANNQDGKRPESITINLLANGTKVDSKVVTEDDNWEWKFDNLDKYKAGVEIFYTLTEDVVEGYSTSVDGYNITNSYTPGVTSRTVNKVWNDAKNKDNIRPKSIQVQLYANGEVCGEEVTLSEANNWSYTWNNLVERSKGKVIIYTVSEVGTVEGYTTTYSEDTFVITNTHTPTEKPKEDTPTEKPKKDKSDDKPTPTPEDSSAHGESLTSETELTANEQAIVSTLPNSEEATLANGNVPKTGEDTRLYICIVAVLLCIPLLIVLGKKKKEDESKEE